MITFDESVKKNIYNVNINNVNIVKQGKSKHYGSNQ